jgi:hypothetical protein
MDEKLLNRIISAAYGDGRFIDRLMVRRIIRRDPEAKRVYDSYRSVARKVHHMTGVTCPPELLEKTKKKINIPVVERNQFLRPAAAFAVIFIAAVLAVFSLMNSETNSEYTAAEIRTAEVQTRQSLALVNRILNRTTSTIGNEILPDKVSKPVQKGLNIINNLLIGG